jgi:hypothetical protein
MVVGEGDGYHELLKEEDGGVGTTGEGGGGIDETQGGGGCKIHGEGGRDGDGEPHAWRCLEELAHGEGHVGNCNRVSGKGKGGSTEEELVDLPTCGGKRREGSRQYIPTRHTGILIAGACGVVMLAFKIFLLSRILVSSTFGVVPPTASVAVVVVIIIVPLSLSLALKLLPSSSTFV